MLPLSLCPFYVEAGNRNRFATYGRYRDRKFDWTCSFTVLCSICDVIGGGRGSAGSSPLRLPATEGDEEEDEMYQDMGGGGGGDGVGDVAGGGSWM